MAGNNPKPFTEADAELMRNLTQMQAGTKPSSLATSLSGKRRVLLVDDSLPFLRNFASILEGMGYEVRTADTGLAAVDVLERFQPHLVALDYNMPGMDGLGTLLQIKQRLPDVKVVFISAMLDQDSATNAILNGANECIAKPVSLSRLKEVVNELIS